jgi:hypothetical protein
MTVGAFMLPARQVCLYQDNPSHFTSVQLAVLSILEHEPLWQIHVSIPECPAWLEQWLSQFQSVRLYNEKYGQSGWDVKPEIILSLLDLLKDEVIWFDSDMILTAPVSPYIDRFPASTLIVAEEPPGPFAPGSALRTNGWGRPIGRSIRKSINSGFIRVSVGHRTLISAWREALKDARYRKAQELDWWLRPAPFYGDQDALSALLGSKDYSDVPIVFLRNGIEIAQCHGPDGYPWQRRIMNAFRRMPALVHAQGKKPWLAEGRTLVHLDVSPYKLAALRYKKNIKDTDWLQIHTVGGRILMSMTFGEPNLAGLAPSLAAVCRRIGGRCISAFRPRKSGSDFQSPGSNVLD